MSTNEEMAEFPRPPPYAVAKDGYSALPQSDPYGSRPVAQQPAQGYYPPAPPPPQPYPAYPGYAPAPPVLQQQSNTNVVVVGQPSTPSTVVVQARPRAPTYLTLTIIMMALCCIHGNVFAFICLVPALICAITADNHNAAGAYEDARQCGRFALGCNLCMFVKYALAVVAGVILLIVYFTAGLAWISGSTCSEECYTDIYGYQTCSYVCT